MFAYNAESTTSHMYAELPVHSYYQSLKDQYFVMP